MHQDDYHEYISDSEEQKGWIEDLVLIRNNQEFSQELYNAYCEAGILYSKSYAHYSGILEEFGYSLQEQGYTKERLFEAGYIVPCYDHLGDTMFYINYSNKRGRKLKYLMIYPENRKDVLTQIKVFGLEDTLQAHEEDRLFITEGVFDRLRLKSQGIPVIATLGSQVTDYVGEYLQRFERVHYIGDNDRAGKQSYLALRDRGLQLNKQYLPTGKDVDDYGKESPDEFREWIKQMR